MGKYKIPVHAMKSIEASLYKSFEIQLDLLQISPDDIAMILGSKSRIPHAWGAMWHTAHVLQVARFNLYLAYHERLYYNSYRKPVDPFTALGQAAWYFTSFSIHALAAENHMGLSMMYLFGIPKPASKFGTPLVRKKLKEAGQDDYSLILDPILGSHWMSWLRKYRDRWVHGNPMRIKGFGLQWGIDFEREFWKTNAAEKTRTLGIGEGDPAETTIEEMLENGRQAFNILARQFDIYQVKVEDEIRSTCQKLNSQKGDIKVKLQRRRPRRVRREPIVGVPAASSKAE